ncbi:MAG TPA: DUF2277 domain-containing protein [Acidimicrobiales bacterium]|nr:DUF2277 domain-containing protein [Acidimicrobiales bacterium]
MCRSIVTLRGEEPATDDEVQAAALQFIRKVSGQRAPSRANQEAFDRAVDEVAVATRRLLDDFVTPAGARPPAMARSRIVAREKAASRQNAGAREQAASRQNAGARKPAATERAG